MNNAEIARRRLQNQRLAKTTFNDARDAVTQLGAVQAQDYAGAKWALGQRLKGATDSALDNLFNDGSILRTHLMRPTWHFVAPADIRWLLKLTAPRVHAASAYMYRQSGLDKIVFNKSNKIVEKALRDGKQLTRTELASALEKAGIPADGFRLGYLMMYAELEGLICSGGRRGKQFTYALLEERVPPARAFTREESLAELTKRYFTTRGPATVNDFSWWSGLTVSDAKRGVDMVRPRLVGEVVDGQLYWYAESKSSFMIKSPTVHLLPNYDEYFIGFKNRRAIGERLGESHVKMDGSAFLAHLVFIDGQLVGGWKRTLEKYKVVVELDIVLKISKTEMQAITNEAEQFGKFLGLQANVVGYNSPGLKRNIRLQ
jgi:hypothetical protein